MRFLLGYQGCSSFGAKAPFPGAKATLTPCDVLVCGGFGFFFCLFLSCFTLKNCIPDLFNGLCSDKT